MAFILTANNVFDYLDEHDLCTRSEGELCQVEPLTAKNFNLLVTLADGRKLLVKQERHDREGNTAGEFLGEWRIQKFLQQFSELDSLRPFLPDVLCFDEENSILIANYLTEYQDLSNFYIKEKVFTPEIPTTIGTFLGKLHHQTYNNSEYENFFKSNPGKANRNLLPQLIVGLERITPEIFGLVPADGLKFFALYQRYDSLGQAIAELGDNIISSCLIHGDLKLNNILLLNDWQQSHHNLVRLIDWERSSWGDLAFDLGHIISSYLHIWLGNLVVSNSFSIEDSLRLATIPLEQIQPSIAALILAYCKTFPGVFQDRPDFLRRVIQFTGFSLIQQIQAIIQYQKSFGNTGILMLQVAKSLLCRPESSMPTIFGPAVAELTQLSTVPV